MVSGSNVSVNLRNKEVFVCLFLFWFVSHCTSLLVIGNKSH